MKRRFTTVMVMLLAFALLISATAISASAETTYSPIGGSRFPVVRKKPCS